METHTNNPATEQERRRGMLFIFIAVGCVGFAMAFQMGLNSNFVVDDIGIDPMQRGVLEAVREICGITALLVIAWFVGTAEPLLGAAMLALFGVGLGSYYFVNTYPWLLMTSVIWSQGQHVWMPLPASMTLSLAEQERTGFRLGQVASAGAIGFGLGLACALLLTFAGIAIRPQFLLAGAFGIFGAIACLAIPRRIKTPGPRLVFKRRYGIYYMLCFLEGWRKQVFLCFAGFLLVREYDASVSVILLLFAATQVITFTLSPPVGKLIDRVGERYVLSGYFIVMTLIFIGYAFVKVPSVLYVLYIFDNSMFMFTMALNTYAHRMVPDNELTPTLSMGVAMNHVASVIMPLTGGLLWFHLGYKWAFLIGAAASICTLAVVAQLPRKSEIAAQRRAFTP